MQLVDTLAADPENCADGGEGLRRIAVEAVVGDDDVTQAGRELVGHVVQNGVDPSLIERGDAVDVCDERSMEQVGGGEAVLKGNGTPDGVGDGRDGIGAKGSAAPRVVVAQCRPQADAALVQGVLEGEVAQPLATDNPVHKTLVPGHLLGQDRVTPINSESGMLTHGGPP